jgi:hypothetical protein
MSKHTPGPWRWVFNGEHRRLHLVGGRPRYDLTVLDFERWGMNDATMRLRDTAHDGMQLLYRVHERPDWIAPESGREHHKHWHRLLTHPDARLIEAAPDLKERLQSAIDALDRLTDRIDGTGFSYSEEFISALDEIDLGRAAIAKAEGKS